jgi:two-component system catabolic regulation response regulator CreB
MVQRQRIYIVDDEVLIARTLAAIFEESGYETEYFTCPRALLEAAGAQPPDALLSDYAMPELSGIELARRIVALCPACRVFLLSATELSLIETWVAKVPTPDFTFFSKPVQVAQLLDAAAHALRLHDDQNCEFRSPDSSVLRTFRKSER